MVSQVFCLIWFSNSFNRFWKLYLKGTRSLCLSLLLALLPLWIGFLHKLLESHRHVRTKLISLENNGFNPTNLNKEYLHCLENHLWVDLNSTYLYSASGMSPSIHASVIVKCYCDFSQTKILYRVHIPICLWCSKKK